MYYLVATGYEKNRFAYAKVVSSKIPLDDENLPYEIKILIIEGSVEYCLWRWSWHPDELQSDLKKTTNAFGL